VYEFEITLLSNRTDTDKKTGLLGLSKNIYPRTGYERPQEEQSYRPTLSLTSALDGVGSQSYAPIALPPEKASGTHCTGGWMGPWAY
jgi:hypothetical protein